MNTKHFLAVHKPSGMITHRNEWTRPHEIPALQLARNIAGTKLYPVHRLDRSTSGVLMFAKSSEAAASLRRAFDEGIIQKTYLALVRGWVEKDQGLIRPVQGKPARSMLEVISHYEAHFPVGRYASARYSLLKLSPLSGRTHQLRRHLAGISHPIIGDTIHGDRDHNRLFRDDFGYSRLWLFCTRLSCTNSHSETLNLHSHSKSVPVNFDVCCGLPHRIRQIFGYKHSVLKLRSLLDGKSSQLSSS